MNNKVFMKITIEIDVESDKEVKVSLSPSSKKNDSNIQFANLSREIKTENRSLLKDNR